MLYCANFPRSFLRLKVPFALFNRFWILLFISPSLFITLPKEVKDFVRLISWSSVVIGDGLDTYTESHDFSFLQADLEAHFIRIDVELCGFVLHLTMRVREHGYVISTKSISLSVLKRDNLILFVSLCCLSHDPVDGQNWKERRTQTRLSHTGLNLIKLLHFKKDITWKKFHGEILIFHSCLYSRWIFTYGFKLRRINKFLRLPILPLSSAQVSWIPPRPEWQSADLFLRRFLSGTLWCWPLLLTYLSIQRLKFPMLHLFLQINVLR